MKVQEDQRETIKFYEREFHAELAEKRNRKPPNRKSRPEPKRRDIAERQNWLCAGEGCPAALKSKKMRAYDIDHIIPLSMGGTEDDDNLQALCPNCHREKTDNER